MVGIWVVYQKRNVTAYIQFCYITILELQTNCNRLTLVWHWDQLLPSCVVCHPSTDMVLSSNECCLICIWMVYHLLQMCCYHNRFQMYHPANISKFNSCYMAYRKFLRYILLVYMCWYISIWTVISSIMWDIPCK